MTAVVPITPESVKRTLCHFAENKGLHFSAYFECAGRNLPCTIDSNWDIHGVTMNEQEFSFIASKTGQKAIKFNVRFKEFIQILKKWFKEIAEKLKPGLESLLEATIPPTILFFAGTTEFTGSKKPSAT